jgi:TPR repeat protein
MPEPPVPHPVAKALEQPSASQATAETKAVPTRAAPPTEEAAPAPVATTPGSGSPSPQLIVAAPGSDTAAAVPLATPPAAPLPQERQPTEAAMRSAPGVSPTMIAALLRRGNSMVQNADISSARRLYRPAADAGSGEAALALGKTYDPHILRESGARGVEGDEAAAIAWYLRALALGIGEARSRLARLGAAPGD